MKKQKKPIEKTPYKRGGIPDDWKFLLFCAAWLMVYMLLLGVMVR